MTMNILLVEDNDQNAYLASYLLEHAGHRVVRAADGREAVERAAASAPDLVLLDLQLPTMDGFQVLTALRAIAGLGDTPVVALTALALPGDRERVLAAGFSGYLAKPIDPHTFVADVARQAAGAPANDARRALIVDDHEKNRYLLRATLEAQGLEVIEASNGRGALGLARARAPDVLITDLLMPDMDGFTLLREWRKDARLAAIPVVVYTATYTAPDDAELVRDLGAARFVIKPAAPRELVAAVFAALSEEPAPAATRPALSDELIEARYGERVRAKLDRKLLELDDARAALLELVTRYQAILDASPGAIISTDGERRVRSVNRAALAMFGYAHEELVGGSVDRLVPDDRRAQAAQLRAEAMRTGAPVHGTCQLLTKGGERLDVEETISWLGPELGYSAVLTDIGDKLRLGSQLAQAETRLARFLSLSSTVLYALERRDGQLLPAWMSDNVHELLGYEPAEALAQDWVSSRVHPDDRDLVLRGARQLLERGRAASEYRVRHRDGSARWVLDEALVVRDPEGAPLEILGTLTDITALRRADEEQQALRAQLASAQKLEAIGRLAGGIAHDFNNMLTVILSYAEFIDAGLPPDSPLHEDAQGIIEAGARAAAMTRQLLAFGRRQRRAPALLDLREVIGAMVVILRRLIGEDVLLTVHHGAELGRVEADRSQLEQVVMNLVVNARDAMPRGGRIDITLADREIPPDAAGPTPPGRFIALTVTDSGAGMDQRTQAQIFEPFFTTKEAGRGTGLGMSVVYGVVRQAGGHIALTSAPGEGTTIEILLPRAEGELAAAKAPKGAVDTTGRGETILLVEDDELVRAVSRRVLEHRGYRVLEAGDGAQALRRAADASYAIDLLLTDLVMPGMSGRELAVELARRAPALRVAFCSGYTEDHAILREAASAGVTFIEKPYDHDELAATVRGVLDGTLPGGVGSALGAPP